MIFIKIHGALTFAETQQEYTCQDICGLASVFIINSIPMPFRSPQD